MKTIFFFAASLRWAHSGSASRSAGLHPAVSPVFNRHGIARTRAATKWVEDGQRSAARPACAGRFVTFLPAQARRTALLCVSLLLAASIFSAQAAPKFIESDSASGTSLAVVTDGSALAHTAQLMPLDEKGQVVGKDSEKQISWTIENLSLALRAANSDLQSIVKINVYATHADLVSRVQKQFAKKFKGKNKPAVSFVIGTLPNPDALVAMDAVAICKKYDKTKSRFHIPSLGGESSFAHVSILPKGGVVYISGQAKPGNLAEATTKTLGSLQDTLTFLGLKKSDVIQIKSFIQPMAEVEIARKQIAKFFHGEKVPPLVFVDWISPSVPIEIEMIVAAPENRGTKESVSYLTPPGFQPSNVYSKVARVNFGKLIYISGLYGDTPGNAPKQVTEIFDLLKRVVMQAGSDFNALAKATYYVSDAAASDSLNKIRPQFYDPKRAPAASKALVKSVGRNGRSVTFDMIAVSEE